MTVALPRARPKLRDVVVRRGNGPLQTRWESSRWMMRKGGILEGVTKERLDQG